MKKNLILTTLNSAELESSLQKRQTLSRAHIKEHIELRALAATQDILDFSYLKLAKSPKKTPINGERKGYPLVERVNLLRYHFSLNRSVDLVHL